MEWKKLGRVFVPDGTLWWAQTHAMIPTPVIVEEGVLRIFITCCDDEGVGRVGYVDLNSKDPTKIINICTEPVLDVGLPGTFDENGTLVCSVIKTHSDDVLLYYAGFELGTKIRYRLLTGLAKLNTSSAKFERVKKVPVLDRTDHELFFRGGPYAQEINDGFEMWYVAGSVWENVKGVDKPVYEIRYIKSKDAINWPEKGERVIGIEKENEHGFGRPYVTTIRGKRMMFYSIRKRDVASYRLGYAEMLSDESWLRKDESIGIDVSDEGWDSEMICYSAVIEIDEKIYMFYNGNEFGKTGFGVAVLK